MTQKVKFLVFFIIIFLIVFQKALKAHIASALLISQQFPQIKLRPLNWVSRQPKREIVEFKNLNEKPIVADIFYPMLRPSARAQPAVILAMGVKTAEKDKPVILGFADTLARLGYVVMWPRLKILDEGVSSFEEPETFIAAFQHLEQDARIDKKRISFIGFSVGSSIAMVAAQNPQITEKVNSFVFFGGYYDIFDYLKSVETKTASFEGQIVSWEPAEGVVTHLKEIQETERFSMNDKEVLEKINPVRNIKNFRAKIFILHEKSDSFVPYLESTKINKALEGRVGKTYLLVNLFEHVQPKKGLSREILAESFKLYLFVAKVLEAF